MTVFVVLNASHPIKVGQALKTNFGENYLQISSGEWLVAASGLTAKDISDKLGISEGTNGSAIIFTTAGYWGRAGNNIWEWIGTKIQQP